MAATHPLESLAVAGGGTAGHVMPGLAVMAALRRRSPDARAVFVGCEGGFENQLVPARGMPLETVPGSPFARQGIGGKLLAAPNLARGVRAARRILRARGVQVVLGLGGYASIGTVVAARTLGIPVAVHEANAVPGLANRLVGARVDLILLGWEQTARAFPATPTQFTGNPLEDVPASIQRTLSLPPRLLVTGGSEGSPFLNRHAPELVRLLPGVEVLHQAGHGYVDEVRARYAALGLDVKVQEFLSDLSTLLRTFDFVVATAGSITMNELAIAGTPSLHVPLSTAAESHQEANAQAFAETAGADWTSEADWAPTLLANRIRGVLENPGEWIRRSTQAQSSARPEAAERILDALAALAFRE